MAEIVGEGVFVSLVLHRFLLTVRYRGSSCGTV